MGAAPENPKILSFEEARHVVEEHAALLGARREVSKRLEEVDLLHAPSRILGEPITADRDFPPFPRATRDGYAVRAADLERDEPALLRVVGQVKAGDSYDLPVASGEAVEIMTGAAMPQGADAVVMVEYTERKGPQPAKPELSGKQASAEPLDIGVDSAVEPVKVIDELVEIRRAAAAGENIVPAGAEAKAGQELLPHG